MVELQADEQSYQSSLDSGVRRVVRGKRLLLLERIASDIGWPDKSLFKELSEGFSIVGCQGPSGVFATELRPALSSVSHFEQSMKFMRPALIGKVKSSPCVVGLDGQGGGERPSGWAASIGDL